MFFYGLQYMNMSLLVYQQGHIQQLCVDTGCNLEDLPRMMDDQGGWWESQVTPYSQHDVMMKMESLIVASIL